MAFHYNVRPRYTPGSPAMVDERTARKVAQEEQDLIHYYLEGFAGAEGEALAKKQGLTGIVEEYHEHAGHWMIKDVITGELSQRPFEPGQRCSGCSAELGKPHWLACGPQDGPEDRLVTERECRTPRQIANMARCGKCQAERTRAALVTCSREDPKRCGACYHGCPAQPCMCTCHV